MDAQKPHASFDVVYVVSQSLGLVGCRMMSDPEKQEPLRLQRELRGDCPSLPRRLCQTKGWPSSKPCRSALQGQTVDASCK